VIAPEGTINFPLAGEVHVEGLDVTQIGHVLRDRLAAGYIREPQVMVTLKALNSKKVYVLGQVRTPGRYAFTEDMTIVEAVTLAGGFANLAERNYTIVTRGTRRIPIPVEKIMQGLASNFPLQPGDIVYVPQSIL
jgi:protein involved in polysaccharide export with SLBB domain